WHDVASETSRDGLLPQVLFGIRDVNADGVQEASVVLRSYGLQSHDEAMFLFQWKGVKQLHLLTKIPFHDATRGGWLMDDASADYPGLEIITVGRQPDPDTLNTALQWYTFTYYAWTGSTYTQFQTCTTVRQYHDAAQAIRSVEW
ncbi:MAG TPA: hypothetical protein VHV83_19475, partial [Armatimonadota bacterium]|nr:hypothetical protein [Armatimonadota bacterium]